MAVVSAEKKQNKITAQPGMAHHPYNDSVNSEGALRMHLEMFASHQVQRGIGTPWENRERNTLNKNL